MPPHAMRVLSDLSTCPTCPTTAAPPDSSGVIFAGVILPRNSKKRSIRQLDPAFVAAIAGNISGFVDQFRNVIEHTAVPLLVVVINERLTTDHLDPPLSPEKLTREAAFLLKINEFEHAL